MTTKGGVRYSVHHLVQRSLRAPRNPLGSSSSRTYIQVLEVTCWILSATLKWQMAVQVVHFIGEKVPVGYLIRAHNEGIRPWGEKKYGQTITSPAIRLSATSKLSPTGSKDQVNRAALHSWPCKRCASNIQGNQVLAEGNIKRRRHGCLFSHCPSTNYERLSHRIGFQCPRSYGKQTQVPVAFKQSQTQGTRTLTHPDCTA